MDPFIRRLVERLLHASAPLSRNRHFHTFENADGRKALRIARRLGALARDLLRCQEEGGLCQVTTQTDASAASAPSAVTIVISLTRIQAHRTAKLDPEEFELLKKLPGIAGVFETEGPHRKTALSDFGQDSLEDEGGRPAKRHL